jgi:dGTPase
MALLIRRAVRIAHFRRDMWRRREDLEDLEQNTLSPWAAQSRHAGGRRLAEPHDPLRTEFQRDRDRVLHSAAFRRLQHKTQVMAAFEGDHFRTRLTHSLEVAQMARSVALALSLNTDLAEAVALGHDLGHPPFGHAGEEVLDELMAGRGGFRHNAQGARIVDYLEDRYGTGFGLNLTAVTRRCLLKGRVPHGFPLSADLSPGQPPLLEAQVVDLCDRIAYLGHDLEDGLRAEAFTLGEARSLELWRAADPGGAPPKRVISGMIKTLIHDVVDAASLQLDGVQAGRDLPPRLSHGDGMAVQSHEVLAFLRARFYRSEQVLRVMRAGRERIRSVFEGFVRTPERLPASARARIERDGVERVACDYVAGMTDRYLMKVAVER